jgi:small subunit ribosomal protein S1
MAEETIEQIAEEGLNSATPQELSELKPKMRIMGKVNRLELYGAFIDLGVGVDAILHISQLDERVNRISDALKVGDEVQVWVDTVDLDRQQVTVSMREPLAVEWSDLKTGQVYTGKVTRLENFGAFVDIGAEKEGLIHVSELSHEYVKDPSEVVKVGDEVSVRIIGFSKRKRRIDLSRKALLESPEQAMPEEEIAEMSEEEEIEMPTAMEIALRRAMGDSFQDIARRAKRSKGSRRSQKRKRRDRQRHEDLLDRTLKLSQEPAPE